MGNLGGYLISPTTSVRVMIVGVQPSLQHLGNFVHLMMLDVFHKFSQVDLTEGVRENERAGEVKQETLTEEEVKEQEQVREMNS